MSSWLLGQTIVATLQDAGVEHFVLCPGSRNTAVSLALAENDQLKLHTRTDERVAGFLALGLAKVAGIAAVVVTSGTAVGNLLPAVMEAYETGVALLVITADRPATLSAVRANQATNQQNIFANHVVDHLWLNSADANQSAWVAQLRRVWASAVGARTGRVGPVQINASFEVPLTPDGSQLSEIPSFQLQPRPASQPTLLQATPGTVVVCGDLAPLDGRQVARLASEANVPLLAEPTSNARHGRTAVADYQRLLQTELAEQINRVVMFGHPTLSRGMTQLLTRADVELVAVGQPRWPDPGHRVSQVLDAVRLEPDTSDWLDNWQQAPSGGRALELVSAVLNVSQTVMFGASNVIRYADRVADWPNQVTSYANRGLAGIDGTIATASGISLAAARPVTAIMGDLTFLHDAGALLIPKGQPEPDLRIVVFDDDGGSIFHSLEVGQAQYAKHFDTVFAMPHAHDLAAIAAGHGVAAERVSTPAQLQTALRNATSGISVFVVEI